MYKCDKCENVEFNNYNSLSKHMSRTHKIDTNQFYVDYYLKGVWPLCKCGCGNKTKWSYQLKGFRDYSQGHQSRVHNNWGHNKKAIEASSETRRKQYASGERQVWNVGLTKETDDRLKNAGMEISNTFTKDRRQRYSDIMRKNRLDGIVPTLKGPNHSQWKGGVSEINVLARARVRLYKEWKYPILVRDGFKCVQCGNSNNLHVHHDKEQMSEIVSRHIVDGMAYPMSFEEKEFIADAVVEYHIKNNVSGITVCSKCHNEIHPSLNFD